MIEINLVPESLRKKKRSQAAPAGPPKGLPKEALIGIIGGFVAILVVLSLFLQFLLSNQIGKRNKLNKEIAEVAAAKTNVDIIMKDLEQIKGRVKTLEEVVGNKRISFAQKLNEVSDNLPRGVWLTKVALEGKIFIIEGSAVSKTKGEINDVHTFAANLKASKNFMQNLKNLKVDMIKARAVETLSVADFTIKAELVK